ncbi:MAG TPA: hypothetical protein VIY73_06190 [Polyangiaceae bacterium]
MASTVGIIKTGQSIPREIWKGLSPYKRLDLVLEGQVEIDDNDLPIVRGEALASLLGDIESALGIGGGR